MAQAQAHVQAQEAADSKLHGQVSALLEWMLSTNRVSVRVSKEQYRAAVKTAVLLFVPIYEICTHVCIYI